MPILNQQEKYIYKRELPMDKFCNLGAMVLKGKAQNLEVVGLEMNTTLNFHLPS